MRYDPVDVVRWRTSIPFYKFVGFMAWSALGGFALWVFGHVIEGQVWLLNCGRKLAMSVWRWSRFLPDVVDEREMPGEFITGTMMGPDAHLCAVCRAETTQSVRVHARCFYGEERVYGEEDNPTGVPQSSTVLLTGSSAEVFRRAADAIEKKAGPDAVEPAIVAHMDALTKANDGS